jgi:hypothetical protein
MMAGTRLTSRAIGQWVAGIVATVLGGVLTFIYHRPDQFRTGAADVILVQPAAGVGEPDADTE